MTTQGTILEDGQSFYVTGGTLRLDAPSYVVRQADEDLLAGLQQGQLCYMLTSRQMGKSSLMVRAATQLRTDGCHVVVIDLTEIGQNLSVEQWYYGLLLRFGEQVDLEDDLIDFWLENKTLGPLQRWITALREVALKRLTGHIVIFIDEIDSVLSLSFSTDEFFAGIRECYNHRTQNPAMERLTFCLLGVATPGDLIQDPRTTPFNIGRRIELADFTFEEAAPLAKGLSQDPVLGQILLRRVLSWTGGQPYLTQRLCRALSECGGSLTIRDVDKQCDELFLCRKARETDDNLAFVRNRLLRSGVEIAALLDMYGQARNRWQTVNYDPTNSNMAMLRLSGIVRVVNGKLSVRNRIYYLVFDKEWIRTNMSDAELQRQRAAYRSGLVRAATLCSFIIAAVVAMAWKIQIEEKNAKEEAKNAREQKNRAESFAEKTNSLLYIANINLAQRELEDLNVPRARQILDDIKNDERGFEWGYLNHLCDLSLQNISEHAGYISGIAVCRNGHHLLVGSSDRSLELCDTQTGKSLWVRTAPEEVVCLACTPDGQHLLTGHPNGMLILWDKNGLPLHTLHGHDNRVNSVAFSPDGKRAASGSDDNTIRIWDVNSGRQLSMLQAHDAPVTGVVFAPGNNALISSSADKTIKVWNLRNPSRPLVIPCLSPCSCVAVAPDGKMIAAGFWDKTARFYDLATGKEPQPFVPLQHKGLVISIAFDGDGKRVATGSSKKIVRLWDVMTRREILRCKGHEDRVTSVAFSPDGKRLYSGSGDGRVKVWDAMADRQAITLKSHNKPIHALAFSPDSASLVTGSEDNTVRIWDMRTGIAARIMHTGGTNESVAFSADGKRIAAACDDRSTYVWEAATGRLVFTIPAPYPSDDQVKGINFAAAFSPDGQYLAIGTDDRRVRLYEAQKGRLVKTLEPMTGIPTCLAFSPDSKSLAGSNTDSKVCVWEVQTGNTLFLLAQHEARVSCVAYSHKGNQIATGSDDKKVILWNAQTGEKQTQLLNAEAVEAVGFSPDDRRILTGDRDNLAKLWDTKSWDTHEQREVLVLSGHKDFVLCAAFSPNGRLIATGGLDDNVKIWEGGSAVNTGISTPSSPGLPANSVMPARKHVH